MPPPDSNEIKAVPAIGNTALSEIESFPTPLYGILFDFLNTQEILGILRQFPLLTSRLDSVFYPRIHITELTIQYGPYYSSCLNYRLQINTDFQTKLSYRIQSPYGWNVPFKEITYPEIEQKPTEENPQLAKKKQLEQFLLNEHKAEITKTLLGKIPKSSLPTFFVITNLMRPNQSDDAYAVNLNDFQYVRKLILDQNKLLKECRKNIILAHSILKAPDPWIQKRLPYVERCSPSAWKFIVFGENENLWLAAVILAGLLCCVSIVLFIGLMMSPGLMSSLGITSDLEKIFLMVSALLVPYIVIPLYYVILKFFATLVTDIPNTLQRTLEIYDTLLKLQANTPESTFLNQEKENIKKVLNVKKTELVQQNGLFSFFNKKAKISSVDKALEALEKISSQEALASFMGNHLNDAVIASLHPVI